VDGPSHTERSQEETIERRINAGRHRRLDDLDAPARIVHQMLRDKRLTQSLDAAVLDDPFARVPLKRRKHRWLTSWSPFPHLPRFSQNLRDLTFDLGAGLGGEASRLWNSPPRYPPAIRRRQRRSEACHLAQSFAHQRRGSPCRTMRRGHSRTDQHHPYGLRCGGTQLLRPLDHQTDIVRIRAWL
jgi:hypothetical protein